MGRIRYLMHGLAMTVVTVLMTGCGVASSRVSTDVLRDDVEAAQIRQSPTVTVLPVVTGGRFDTAAVHTDRSMLAMMEIEERGVSKIEFEALGIGVVTREQLMAFYALLMSREPDDNRRPSRVWTVCDTRYILLVTLESGVRIRGEGARITRRVSYQADLWDTQSRRIVWQARTRSVETGSQGGDEAFIRVALSDLCRKVPLAQRSVMESW